MLLEHETKVLTKDRETQRNSVMTVDRKLGLIREPSKVGHSLAVTARKSSGGS